MGGNISAEGQVTGQSVFYRRIADYIAGMTDRFAIAEYEKHCGMHDERSRFFDNRTSRL